MTSRPVSRSSITLTVAKPNQILRSFTSELRADLRDHQQMTRAPIEVGPDSYGPNASLIPDAYAAFTHQSRVLLSCQPPQYDQMQPSGLARLTELATLLHDYDDISTLLAAFLTWNEVRDASWISRSVYESTFRRRLVRKSCIHLPPSAAFVSAFVLSLHSQVRNTIRSIDIADAESIRCLACLPAVKRLRVRGGVSHTSFALNPTVLHEVGTLRTNLTRLDLSNSSVDDISGLHGAPQLKILNLSGTLARDFTVLETLTTLEYLNLQQTQVTDIEFLRATPNLRELNLNATKQLVDLHPISYLTRLRSVYLSKKHIATLTPLLVSASTLTLLQLVWTQFDDDIMDEWRMLFSKLTELDHLNMLGVKQLTSLAPLSQLTKLKYLNVQACRVDILAPLHTLQDLETLVLGWSNAYDFTVLRSLQKLKRLDAQGKQLKSVEFLPELEYFKGYGTLPRLPKTGRLQEVSFCFSDDSFTFRLAALPFLRSLSLSGKLDLQVVTQSVPTLRQLELFITETLDLSAVAQLKQLRKLTIRYSSVPEEGQDYSFLKNLTLLRQLRILNSSIEDLSLLERMKFLKILTVESSLLDSISPVQRLRALEQIDFARTLVTDASALLELPSLERIVLPDCADCKALAAQYGTERPKLREVMHGNQNCIWSSHQCPPISAPIMGPTMYTQKPFWGPGIPIDDHPAIATTNLGPKSRAGLKPACDNGAIAPTKLDTVNPIKNGACFADGRAWFVSSRTEWRHIFLLQHAAVDKLRIREIVAEDHRRERAIRFSTRDRMELLKACNRIPIDTQQADSAQHRAKNLRSDIREHFVHWEARFLTRPRERDRHGRVQVRAGDVHGQERRERDEEAPDDRDLPDPDLHARGHTCSTRGCAHEHQEPRAQHFGSALAQQ
ncbi:Leucine-rich repeat protein, partial [Globisporangium splendens]